MSKKSIIYILASIILILGAGAGYYYYAQKSKINRQIADINLKLKELPDLEKDIFTKCMEGKAAVAQNIAFCQENTQKQMFTLAEDLTNAKKDLQGKNWYQVLKYVKIKV